MRSKLNKLPLVALAACLALVCNLNSQSTNNNFRVDDPVEVTNQDGQKILLVGMQGSSVIFQFAGEAGAEASIPIDEDSRIRLSYPYPDNFSETQLRVLNGNYDRALRLIREPPIDLLRFLSIPESNCNFHLYGEIYYRALVNAGEADTAVEATAAVPWGSRHLPSAFNRHAGTLLNRMVSEEEIEPAESLLAILQEGLSVTEFSKLALPVADRLRLLGENDIVESIYEALSESSDEETRDRGLLWMAYNLANTGNVAEATSLLEDMGEISEDSPLFGIYCLAHGRLAMAEENSIQALRFLSRAMVRTTIADSYKPEIYFLMIQSYMMDEDMVPARRLTREMAVFYPRNMWLESIKDRFPKLEGLEQPTL
ncbi:MAG: hypothetical protein R6U56_00330 [Opitutales bacterium]